MGKSWAGKTWTPIQDPSALCSVPMTKHKALTDRLLRAGYCVIFIEDSTTFPVTDIIIPTLPTTNWVFRRRSYFPEVMTCPFEVWELKFSSHKALQLPAFLVGGLRL